MDEKNTNGATGTEDENVNKDTMTDNQAAAEATSAIADDATPEELDVVVDDQGADAQKRMRRTLAVVAVILIILLLLGCLLLNALLGDRERPAEDTGGVTWIRSVYAYGPEPRQFIAPSSGSFQPGSTDLWITDPSSYRMVRFDWHGNFQEVWYNDGEGLSVNFPTRIAVASNGDMWITETTYSRVYVYDSNQNRINMMHVPRPHSIAINDNIAIVGTVGGIAAFERDGTLIGFLGERGREDGMFDIVNGVLLEPDNTFYVVDTFNARLSKYNPDFEREWIVGLGEPISAGSSEEALARAGQQTDEFPAGMQMPMGITMDAAGRLIIIDNMDFSVAAFDPADGSFLGKWGTFGMEHGQFMNPSDISYDPITDSFLVSDNGNGRIQIISLPDSGGDLVSQLNRLLNGPLSACLIPLLLIILFIILMTIWNFLKKRRERALLAEEEDVALADAEDMILESSEADNAA
ncbi:MAG: NHL repeat-containing protein [Coriobacteriia bacterium]|nr:NHL repeat-containing protein [Coriobacteriia bacterium]MCL2605678.1 NHL repeat-containing protein [Coriobacteriia bacterium]